MDAAQSYGPGHSEAVIGRALKGRQEDVVVATKFGPTFDRAAGRYTGSAVPLPGFRTRAQAEENAGALAKGPLLPDAMAEIERLIDRPPEGPPRER